MQAVGLGAEWRASRRGEAIGLYASGRLGLLGESLSGHTPRGSAPVVRMSPAGFVGDRGYRVGVAVSGWNFKALKVWWV
jgi:hypothetical protein